MLQCPLVAVLIINLYWLWRNIAFFINTLITFQILSSSNQVKKTCLSGGMLNEMAVVLIHFLFMVIWHQKTEKLNFFLQNWDTLLIFISWFIEIRSCPTLSRNLELCSLRELESGPAHISYSSHASYVVEASPGVSNALTCTLHSAFLRILFLGAFFDMSDAVHSATELSRPVAPWRKIGFRY